MNSFKEDQFRSISNCNTTKKIRFSIKDFFSKFFTFTEEILNGKLYFFM